MPVELPFVVRPTRRLKSYRKRQEGKVCNASSTSMQHDVGSVIYFLSNEILAISRMFPYGPDLRRAFSSSTKKRMEKFIWLRLIKIFVMDL